MESTTFMHEDPDVDRAWREEVMRRAEEVRPATVTTVPWNEVKRKARTLLDGG